MRDAPRSHTHTIEGLGIRSLQWGPDNGAAQVLLLHGLSSSARVWGLVAPRLAESGLSVLAFDQRGHGQSDDFEGSFDLDRLAADIAEIHDACGLQRPLLVGHSWGAILALHHAARYADKPQGPGGIVLIDGGIVQFSDFPEATWPRVREALQPPVSEGLSVDALATRLRAPERPWKPDQEAFEHILAAFHISPGGKITPRVSHTRYMQAVRVIWEFQAYERFERVRCPVLMLPVRPPEPVPMRDQAYILMKERGIARAAEVLANFQCQWMEDSVHDVILQRPGELAEKIIQFAADVNRGRQAAGA